MPDLDRRHLIAGGIAAAAIGARPGIAQRGEAPSFVLRNALLETGYDRVDGEVIATRTARMDVVVRNGLVAAVSPAGPQPPPGLRAIDARGLLLLPAFRDMHIHIDKTDYPGPWVAPRKRRNGIPGQIALERRMLPLMLPQVEARAGKLVDLMQANGTGFARVQCNVDPVIGTKHVELLTHMFARRGGSFGHELVAFPQHGLVSADMAPMMRRALEVGATHVGGIDPTVIDGGMERSVDTILQIALDYRRPIDIHLHEPGASGIAAIRRVCDRVDREPGLRGQVTFSHAFALMSLSPEETADLAARMAGLGMSIATTLPMGGRVMPVPILLDKGVRVFAGTDSIYSYWSVFGTADILAKANLACQLYGWTDEYAIARSLRLATGGPTPLDAAGNRAWPRPGDAADFVLLPASCSAEAIARQPARRVLFHRGNLAAGTI